MEEVVWHYCGVCGDKRAVGGSCHCATRPQIDLCRLTGLAKEFLDAHEAHCTGSLGEVEDELRSLLKELMND